MKVSRGNIILKLNQIEAEWLKGLVQNPMCHPSEEPKEDREMRLKLWIALGGQRPEKSIPLFVNREEMDML